MTASSLSRGLNAAGLLGCSGILVVAFWYQIVLGELPCPLCILQRIAFVAAGLGLVLNLCDRPRPSHYGMVVISAVVGFGIAARQTLLHIVPGTGTYGEALLGLHFYVWSLIAFAVMILGIAILCLWDGQFAHRPVSDQPAPPASVLAEPTLDIAHPVGPRIGPLALAAVFLFVAVALANAGSTFAECGLGLCPDNPTRYEMIDRLLGR